VKNGVIFLDDSPFCTYDTIVPVSCSFHYCSAGTDSAIRENAKYFFKEEIMGYGMKTAAVIAIAKKYWKEIQFMEKKENRTLCEELYRSGNMEETFIVSCRVRPFAARYEPDDLAVFRHWIDTYIFNWAACNRFCNHTIGDFIEQYTEYIEELKRRYKNDFINCERIRTGDTESV
jgi:3-methyladenine DNA glycosylase AlkD